MRHTSDTEPGPAAAPAVRKTARRIWTFKPVVVILAFLLVGVGYAVGTAGAVSAQDKFRLARIRLSTLHGRLSRADAKLSTEKSAVKTAQTQASQAAAQAQAKYASQEAALQTKEQGVRQTQRALDALEGKLQASSICQGGVYAVGQDIKGGTWHTPVDGGQNDDAVITPPSTALTRAKSATTTTSTDQKRSASWGSMLSRSVVRAPGTASEADASRSVRQAVACWLALRSGQTRIRQPMPVSRQPESTLRQARARSMTKFVERKKLAIDL